MKSLLRSIIFLISAAVIAAFFMPWVSLEISGIKLIGISGFDILREVDSVKQVFQNQLPDFRIKLLLIPGLCIFIIIAIIKKWKSFIYMIPAILIFGYYIYIIIDTYEIISKAIENITQGKLILDKLAQLKGIKEKTINIDYKIAGNGLYITVIGFTAIILLGIKEMFTSGKKKY